MRRVSSAKSSSRWLATRLKTFVSPPASRAMIRLNTTATAAFSLKVHFEFELAFTHRLALIPKFEFRITIDFKFAFQLELEFQTASDCNLNQIRIGLRITKADSEFLFQIRNRIHDAEANLHVKIMGFAIDLGIRLTCVSNSVFVCVSLALSAILRLI